MAFETFTARTGVNGRFGGLAGNQVARNDGGQEVAQALGGLGRTIGGVADFFDQAQRESVKTEQLTGALRDFDALEQKYQNDPDPATAPERYEEEAQRIRQDRLGAVQNPNDRQQLDLSLTRVDLSAANSVRTRAVARQADSFSGNLDEQGQAFLGRFVRAGSDTERATARAEYEAQINRGVQSGWISSAAGVNRLQAFDRSTQGAALTARINENPDAALAELNDPARVSALDPVQVESLRQQAQARRDGLIQQDAVNTTRFDPVRGIATIGRVTSRDQVALVVDKALIPQESSGNPDAVSKKGAAGLTQFMPGTARAVAKQMGIADFDEALTDSDVRGILKAKPALARRMAQFHLSDLAARYDGRLAPAFAAYHAGAGAADKWHQAALAKFGPVYSVAEFQSVVPASVTDGDKATRDYVGDLFRRLGAEPKDHLMSPGARLTAASAVDTELNSQMAERKRAINDLVKIGDEQRDDISANLKEGYGVDPVRLASAKAPLIQAAALGNADAARQLRAIETQEAIAPIVRAAYQLPPSELESAVAAEEARLMNAADVRPMERVRLDAMRGVLTEQRKAVADNPIGLAERAGRVQPVAIDAGAPVNDPGLVRALSERGLQSAQAQGLYGGALRVFKPAEREAFQARWGDMRAGDRAAMLGSLASALEGRALDAAVTEIAGDKSLAATAVRVSRGDPKLMREILIGSELLKEDGAKPQVEDLTRALKEKLPSDVYPPEVMAGVIDAAKAVYAYERQQSGLLFDPTDRAGLESAIERVAGKMVRINGRAVPVPPGTQDWQVADGFAGLDQAKLDAAGGAFGADGTPFEAAFIARRAQLKPERFGAARYRVFLPQGGELRPVMTKDKTPLVIDLDTITTGAWRPASRGAIGTTKRREIRRYWRDREAADMIDAGATP